MRAQFSLHSQRLLLIDLFRHTAERDCLLLQYNESIREKNIYKMNS